MPPETVVRSIYALDVLFDTSIYPHTDVAAFLTWELPTEGVALWDWQAGRCAMCGQGRECGITLCLDHCHATGLIRGYLCRTCNFDEGKRIDPAWLWWHAGRHPARLLDCEEVWINPVGYPHLQRRDDADYIAASYVGQIAVYAESIGRELSRPFTWEPDADAAGDEQINAAVDKALRARPA